MSTENSTNTSPSLSDVTDVEKLQLATCFLTDLLKNYKLYKENSGIFSPVYTVCDHCYSIRPKWSSGRVDYYNFVHDLMFCSDCWSSLDETSKKSFEKVKYQRETNGGLYQNVRSNDLPLAENN